MKLRALPLALVGLVLLLPETAGAAPTACATAPAAYTGTDATVAALTQLNIDADQNCKAVTDRLDALDVDMTAAATAAHADAVAIDHDVRALAPPSGGGGSSVSVTNWPADQTVALDSASQTFADAQAAGLSADLWVVCGVLIGCFALVEVLRRVYP